MRGERGKVRDERCGVRVRDEGGKVSDYEGGMREES